MRSVQLGNESLVHLNCVQQSNLPFSNSSRSFQLKLRLAQHHRLFIPPPDPSGRKQCQNKLTLIKFCSGKKAAHLPPAAVTQAVCVCVFELVCVFSWFWTVKVPLLFSSLSLSPPLFCESVHFCCSVVFTHFPPCRPPRFKGSTLLPRWHGC